MKSIMGTVIRINRTSQELKYRWITVLALIEFAKELQISVFSKKFELFTQNLKNYISGKRGL